jgi:hypothetical protein
MAAPFTGGELQGPTPFDLIVTDEPDIPYNLALSIEYRLGRYECTALSATPRDGGPAVTAAGLRAIPLGALVRQSVQGQVLLVRDRTSSAPGVTKLTMGALPVPRRPEPAPGRRGRRQTQDDVDAAAFVYCVAQMCGEPPTKAVADELHIPLGTARKLVARAVAADLVPAAS